MSAPGRSQARIPEHTVRKIEIFEATLIQGRR